MNPLRKAWRFLHGGFSIRRIDNFVVTAGRSSCCSWVHQVYRIPTSEREITAQDLAYDITVSGPIEKDSTTARCRITRPEGEVGDTDVPHQSLRQLCHFYDDDVVINPDDQTVLKSEREENLQRSDFLFDDLGSEQSLSQGGIEPMTAIKHKYDGTKCPSIRTKSTALKSSTRSTTLASTTLRVVTATSFSTNPDTHPGSPMCVRQ